MNSDGPDPVKPRNRACCWKKSDGHQVQQSLDVIIAELNTIEAALTPAKNK
jgi:hypothetical protein